MNKQFRKPERFWSKVDVGEPDECWGWLASKRNGYGNFGIHGRTWYSHRVAWILTFGPIPGGLCVLHKCDNRGCCNPYHLFLGTRTDNADDSTRKGRKAKKLLPEEVLEVKELLDKGLTHWEIAEIFEVSRSAITCINRGKTWSWLL